MMQVEHNKPVVIKTVGRNRAGPGQVSPTESNLVKPLNHAANGSKRGEKNDERYTGTTTFLVVNGWNFEFDSGKGRGKNGSTFLRELRQ
jgi:hypothetical protein